MSQNQQTVFLREYVSIYPVQLERDINTDLDRLRAEHVLPQRVFVKSERADDGYNRVAYLTAYIQRPKPKEESPSAHLDAVLDDAGEWEPVEAVGQLSV